MDIFAINKLIIFFIAFMPGFVCIKVYDLLIANEPRDFSKSFLEALAYSAVNFVLLLPLIWLFYEHKLYNNIWLVIIFSIIAFFITPLIWPVAYVKLLRWKWLTKHIFHPIKRPWDWFFNQKQPAWVIVTLTDGHKIGGIYSEKSYASSFPSPEQIYLEQIWQLDENNHFVDAIQGSKGVIILGKDMSTIEFFTTEAHYDKP